MHATIDGKVFRVTPIKDKIERPLPLELIKADHWGDLAKVHVAHYLKCGIWVWKFTLTTPNGVTRDIVYDHEEAKKLWNFLIDVVDAWDEYGKEDK